MDNCVIKKLADGWSDLISNVIELKEFDCCVVQGLLKKTYTVLKEYRDSSLVPKEVSRMLLAVDEFLYYSSMMEDNEVPVDFYQYKAISDIVYALKNGFFGVDFEYVFPGKSGQRMYEIDMVNNGVNEYFQYEATSSVDRHCGIKLIG